MSVMRSLRCARTTRPSMEHCARTLPCARIEPWAYAGTLLSMSERAGATSYANVLASGCKMVTSTVSYYAENSSNAGFCMTQDEPKAKRHHDVRRRHHAYDGRGDVRLHAYDGEQAGRRHEKAREGGDTVIAAVRPISFYFFSRCWDDNLKAWEARSAKRVSGIIIKRLDGRCADRCVQDGR